VSRIPAAVHESLVGPKLQASDVGYLVVMKSKADMPLVSPKDEFDLSATSGAGPRNGTTGQANVGLSTEQRSRALRN
jgi:hypothetical protein